MHEKQLFVFVHDEQLLLHGRHELLYRYVPDKQNVQLLVVLQRLAI